VTHGWSVITRWALRLAADRVREPLGAKCPHGAPDLAVVEVAVENDVEDVVEQLETLQIRLESIE